MEKTVILQRLQPSEFKVFYPYGQNGTHQEYTWMGTKGKIVNERPVPMDVFMWLKEYTRTFELGALVIKETEDEDVKYVKENITDIEQAEKSALTRDEIVEMLEKGNHNALKSALNKLVADKSEDLQKEIKRQVVQVSGEVGIDSVKKREILCDWAGFDYENSGDVLFDVK